MAPLYSAQQAVMSDVPVMYFCCSLRVARFHFCSQPFERRSRKRRALFTARIIIAGLAWHIDSARLAWHIDSAGLAWHIDSAGLAWHIDS